jgi:PAS domain S-box-containing protein
MSEHLAASGQQDQGFYRMLLEHLPIVSWMIDREGVTHFITANALEIFGWKAEEICARGAAFWTEESHPDDRALVERRHRDPFTGERYDVEYRFRHPRKGWIWIRERAVMLATEAGPALACGASIDVTRRKFDEGMRRLFMDGLIRAQEEERGRIARELHDDTAQWLASLLVGLGRLESARTIREVRTQIGALREHAVEALAHVRRLAERWRPPLLDDLGLVAALERFVSRDSRLKQLDVKTRVAGLGAERLPVDIETALYRIAQEALTNAATHAGATRAEVSLTCAGDTVRLTVTDDGCGFDVESALHAAADSGHLGLYSMRERARLLDGLLRIDSAPGGGTTVYAELPLAAGRSPTSGNEGHDGDAL